VLIHRVHALKDVGQLVIAEIVRLERTGFDAGGDELVKPTATFRLVGGGLNDLPELRRINPLAYFRVPAWKLKVLNNTEMVLPIKRISRRWR
jgi:hypothetical protein